MILIEKKCRQKPLRNKVSMVLAYVMAFSFAWSGIMLPAEGTQLLAAETTQEQKQVRVYTFKEVGDIAQNNGTEIRKQKAALDQAESKQDEASINYQIAAFEYWYNGGTGDESSSAYSQLYSLQSSFESAVDSADDAEESLEKLKPKVRYDAQKLYINLLLDDKNIELQKKDLEIKKMSRDLEKVKLVFGNSTQKLVEEANSQVEEAEKSLANLVSNHANNQKEMRIYLDLPENEPFELAKTIDFGQYKSTFVAAEVEAAALENSLSLKQAKRSLEKIDQQIEDYRRMGKKSQAEQLAYSGNSTQINMDDTINSIKSKVKSTLEDLAAAEKNIAAMKKKQEQAQIDYLTNELQYQTGRLTKSALQNAEKSLKAAAVACEQAQYDYYFAVQRVILLEQGILVN
jgi:outer membrane protein TolC